MHEDQSIELYQPKIKATQRPLHYLISQISTLFLKKSIPFFMIYHIFYYLRQLNRGDHTLNAFRMDCGVRCICISYLLI